MKESDVEQLYLYINKNCGTVAGTWPYVEGPKKWLGRITMISIAVSSLVTQLARVITFWSTQILIEQCPFLMVAIGSLLKEINYIIREKEMRIFFQSVYEDWVTNRPQSELNILHKYAKRGLLFCRLYFANGVFCYVIFTAVALRPRIMDLLSPKNESRGVGFIYPAYYILDEEEYYYILMGHEMCVITMVFFVYISCDSMYMNIVQHACGLLSISGHRFKCAFKDIITEDEIKNVKIMQETYQRVCDSIKAHQHARDYIRRTQSVHEVYFFFTVALVITAFSVTLVKASMLDRCVEFYKYCGFVVVQLVHLLFLCIQGHFIILATDELYDSVYSAFWYNSTPNTQALYVLVLRDMLTSPVLSAVFMILNLESFTEILKGSVSYFTVLKST